MSSGRLPDDRSGYFVSAVGNSSVPFKFRVRCSSFQTTREFNMNLKPQPRVSAETRVKPKPAGVMEITLSLLPPKSRSSDKSCLTMRAHRRFDSKMPSVISRGCFPQRWAARHLDWLEAHSCHRDVLLESRGTRTAVPSSPKKE